ncbi:MAG: hypothetical protein FJ297_14630 [Planctomycetes bacterium]|nr:hypothetical protein [Planctomycetota bacterium]
MPRSKFQIAIGPERPTFRAVWMAVGAALALALAGGGCAKWSVEPTENKPWQWPAPRMSADTVVLEVAFLRATHEVRADVERLWSEVDEQAIDADLRRRLYVNGLRCGVVSSQLPSVVHDLLSRQAGTVDSPDLEKQDHDLTSRQYRLQSREGHRTTIATGDNADLLNVFVSDSGAVRGETFARAQCVFGLRSFALGDGRARIELVPEIEHGEPRNRRVGSEGVWRLEFGRDRKSYDALRIDATLAPGQTFLISGLPDPIGLGGAFFAKQNQESSLLVIRVAQTQKDALFESESPRTPIATPEF